MPALIVNIVVTVRGKIEWTNDKRYSQKGRVLARLSDFGNSADIASFVPQN